MKSTTTLLSIGVLAATMTACSSTRMDTPVSSTRMDTPAASTPAPTQTVSSDKLRQFTLAAQKVDAISREYGDSASTSTASATVPADDMRAREANGKKAEAVNSEGLSVPEFNAIAMAVQQDRTLLEQYSSMMR